MTESKGPSNSRPGFLPAFLEQLYSSLFSSQSSSLHYQRQCERDLATLSSRSSHEGPSFLTKTLPKLGKALDRALETLRFNCPAEFVQYKTTKLPAFLRVHFNLVFHEDGLLRATADPLVVSNLRQFLFIAYKYEQPSPQGDIEAAERFVACEKEIARVNFDADPLLPVVVARLLEGFDPKDVPFEPKHGPGKTADGSSGSCKWNFKVRYDSIHRVYPYYSHMMRVSRNATESLLDYKSLKVAETGVSKFAAVPKDSRGKRSILMEPAEYMFAQQAFAKYFVKYLESEGPSKGHINFTDQSVNQKLAALGSLTGGFSTLDLKDASDRVTLRLVEHAFSNRKDILQYLTALRTPRTLMPDGSTIELKKFAGMGSALCFPTEALLFYAISVAAICKHFSITVDAAIREVHVYGDDIIVNSEYAWEVIDSLEQYGLKVNTDKSYVHGEFKESCGADYFKGRDVTPLRLRTFWTGRRSDVLAYASFLSLYNAFRKRGMKDVSLFLKQQLHAVYGRIPYGTENAAYPCFVHSDPGYCEAANAVNGIRFRERNEKDPKKVNYQRPEFYVRYVGNPTETVKLNPWKRLLRDLATPLLLDADHEVLPKTSINKFGWKAIY